MTIPLYLFSHFPRIVTGPDGEPIRLTYNPCKAVPAVECRNESGKLVVRFWRKASSITRGEAERIILDNLAHPQEQFSEAM